MSVHFHKKAIGALTIVLIASTCWSDDVHLNDGSVVQGSVTIEEDGDQRIYVIRGSDGVTLRIPASRIREIAFTPDAIEDKSRTSNDVTPPVVPSPTSLTQKRTSRDPSAPIAFGLAAGVTIYFVDKAMANSGGISLPVLGG